MSEPEYLPPEVIPKGHFGGPQPTCRDPNRRPIEPGVTPIQPKRQSTLPRTRKPETDALHVFREDFVHWMRDETQDPYAQRAFRVLLRNKDMKLRLEAWKVAAAVLAPGSAIERPKAGDQKVAIQFVNKVARPERAVPVEKAT